MSWKKNAFSYILWLVYAVLVSVGVLGVAVLISRWMGFPQQYGIAVAVGCLPICGLLVLGLRKLWRKCIGDRVIGGTIPAGILEGLIVVALIAVGIYLRLEMRLVISQSVEGMVFYDAATVEAGKSIPQVVHGATYLYLYLLHWAFVFLGNKLIVAVGMQTILQVLAGVLLYFAVRKLVGVLPGIVTVAFVMVSPFMLGESLRLSPAYLFLCAYALGLLLIGSILPKRKGNPVWYVIVGILVGLVIYLDIFGVTLLLVLTGVLTVKREHHEKFRNSRVAVFLFGILGSVAGFLSAIGVDTFASGKEFLNVLAAWGEIYFPQEFSMKVFLETSPSLIELTVLVVLLTLGIFSFWCRRHYEKQAIWVSVTIALIALQSFQMMLQNEGSAAYVYIFMAILSGVALDAIFVIDRPETEAESEEEAVEESKSESATLDGDDDLEIVELPVKQKTQEEQPEEPEEIQTEEPTEKPIEERTEAPKVQFLENPLPLPKKHEPKVMDYKISEASNKNDFDIDVADDDDFDI